SPVACSLPCVCGRREDHLSSDPHSGVRGSHTWCPSHGLVSMTEKDKEKEKEKDKEKEKEKQEVKTFYHDSSEPYLRRVDCWEGETRSGPCLYFNTKSTRQCLIG